MTHSPPHKTRNGQPSATSRIRTALTDALHRAGDTVTIDPSDYEDALPRLRIKVSQAAKTERIEIEQRTIDGHICVMRRDMDRPLPGMGWNNDDLLHSLMPWPDDPLFEEKREALFGAMS